MTNLLAAIVITLSTNVTVEDNRPTKWVQSPCTHNWGPNIGCAVAHGRIEKYGEATEKTETEVVTQSRALRFVFEWETYDVPIKQLPVEVSRRVRTSKLESQWKVGEWKKADHLGDYFRISTNKFLVTTNSGQLKWRSTPIRTEP